MNINVLKTDQLSMHSIISYILLYDIGEPSEKNHNNLLDDQFTFAINNNCNEFF